MSGTVGERSRDMEVEVASEGRGDEEGQAEGRVERQGDGAAPPPVAEASNLPLPRLRSRSLLAPRLSLFLSKAGKSKAKSLTTASRIAKRFEQTPRRQSVERKQRDEAPAKTASKDMGGDAGSGLPSGRQEDEAEPPSQSIGGGISLRRSTRQRRTSAYMDLDSDSEADDQPRRRRIRVSSRHAFRSVKLKLRRRQGSQGKKASQVSLPPRRAGLRPREGRTVRQDYSQDYEEDDESEDQSSSDGDDEEVGDDAEDDEDEQREEEEQHKAGRGQEHRRRQPGRKQQAREEEVEEREEERGEEDDEDEEEEDDEEAEEGDGRRRYALRSRTEVQRFSPRKDERPSRARSPRKLYHSSGAGTKRGHDGRPRSYKRQRADDSDDSLLVDEMDQGPGGPWTRAGRSSSHPFVPPGGLGEVSAAATWSLSNTGVGWGNGNPSDFWNTIGTGTGAQTAGQTSKGGADIQPVRVDESVTFDHIGGLSKYINSLKEMVFFPLMYPQFFANYHINPPRGVLLCGPPGTGKTLVARALAAAASRAGKKVSFFMRKGADVLSKWVGETERQLKMLFEEAQRCQPSIIFFDEIDGLAPVRSSKQEQIHNSIVSTLLALMDGLDSRGQVVVIGATNRVDAVDSALRRPGRFDREFFFPLPDAKAREAILDIHTRNWASPPGEELRSELAASCVGYCGADLKALCTEAAIRAFRKTYPQVYQCDEQFILDVDSVEVGKRHFVEAMSSITPASHRGAIVHARPMPAAIASCLRRQVDTVMAHLKDIFIPESTDAALSSDDEELESYSCLGVSGLSFPVVYRPRFLICGGEGTGLDYIAPGILHELERYPVHSLSLPSLLSDPGAKSPEEALVHVFQEARRNTPCILYLPHLELWWETAHDQLRAVLIMLLMEVPPDLPVLLLGTSSVVLKELDEEVLRIFGQKLHELELPSEEDRRRFFRHMVDMAVTFSGQRRKKKCKQKVPLPVLPKAPVVERGPSEAELLVRAETQEHAIRRLRMSLRDVCNRLLYEKRFSVFHYPVTEQEAPGYRNVVESPMDVASLLQRVDSGYYMTRETFFRDVELIPANAKAYNGDDYTTNRIYSKACALRDAVHSMLSQLDPSLVAQCDAIAAQGGPAERPNSSSSALANPLELAVLAVPKASAGIRGVQPDYSTPKAWEPGKRSRKSSEGGQPGEHPVQSPSVVEEGLGGEQGMEVDVGTQASVQFLFVEGAEEEVNLTEAPEFPNKGLDKLDTQTSRSSLDNVETLEVAAPDLQGLSEGPPSTSEGDGREETEIGNEREHELVEKLVKSTEGYRLSQLESLLAQFRTALSRTNSIVASLTSIDFDSFG